MGMDSFRVRDVHERGLLIPGAGRERKGDRDADRVCLYGSPSADDRAGGRPRQRAAGGSHAGSVSPRGGRSRGPAAGYSDRFQPPRDDVRRLLSYLPGPGGEGFLRAVPGAAGVFPGKLRRGTGESGGTDCRRGGIPRGDPRTAGRRAGPRHAGAPVFYPAGPGGLPPGENRAVGPSPGGPLQARPDFPAGGGRDRPEGCMDRQRGSLAQTADVRSVRIRAGGAAVRRTDHGRMLPGGLR